MSMMVHIALKGITDLELLLEALREIGIKTERAAAAADKLQDKKLVAVASFGVRRVGFARDKHGNIHMVGEMNSPPMQNENLQNKIRQHYSLPAVVLKKFLRH